MVLSGFYIGDGIRGVKFVVCEVKMFVVESVRFIVVGYNKIVIEEEKFL